MKTLKLLSILMLLALITTSFGSAFAIKNSKVFTDSLISDGETTGTQKVSHHLIVELQSDPLAVWAKRIGNLPTRNGGLDLSTPQAQTYIARLQAE